MDDADETSDKFHDPATAIHSATIPKDQIRSNKSTKNRVATRLAHAAATTLGLKRHKKGDYIN